MMTKLFMALAAASFGTTALAGGNCAPRDVVEGSPRHASHQTAAGYRD